MNAEGYQRKISAIWSADVAGYSRLMGEDEEATVRTISTYRETMADLIAQHRGRLIDSPGDNLLAEFASVVDSLRCAVEIQQKLAAMNTRLAENRRMVFRIGINVGDVIEKDGRLYGDGVNVAARLESLAEPGGITISGTAYDQVKQKLPYRFEFIGEQPVKNIQDPVRTYRVVTGTEAPARAVRVEPNGRRLPRAGMLGLITAAIVVLAIGFYFWADMHARSLSDRSPMGPAGDPLAQRASIAVLPFKNLSGDPQQEYFSDGITNDIITDLSRFRDLLVIASNTVFTYKSKPVNIQSVGRELGVGYILEGSVQKVGDRVRINAQLIDAADETHLWAERYERDYADIFKLQNDLVQSIVATLAVNISQTERARAMRKQPQDLQAYDYLLRGWALYHRRTRVSNNQAGKMFAKAVELAPHYAAAYVGLGWVDYAKVGYGWTEFPQKALKSAFASGRKALELDASSASAHTLLCNVYTFQNQYDLAIREAEQALELNPNDAYALSQLGWALLWAGRLDEAVAALEMSLRLDNTSVRNAWLHLGTAYYLKGQYGQALEILEKGVVKRPDFVGYHIALAATYARLGRPDDARRAANFVHRLDPFFKVKSFGTAFREPAHRAAIVEGLREAGLN
jgi:adenylate cyclase